MESDTEEEEVEEEDSEEDVHEEVKEEQPPAKRVKFSRDVFCLKLRSGKRMYITCRDQKDLLLPYSEEPEVLIRNLISATPIPMKERLLYLANFTPHHDMNTSDYLNEIISCEPPVNIPHLRTRVLSAYLKEIRLRNAFRKVLQRWRVHQMEKRYTPTEDPITLEMPDKPVYVYDWRNKKKFVFDAKSLATYLDSKMMYHENGFPSPIYPRNPWTNSDFSYSQLVSIYQQLKAHGELRWAFLTFRRCQFNESRWLMYHGSTLTMNAIQTNLIALDTVDARELLEDFIVAKMEELGYNVSDTILSAYRIAMKHLPNHWYIQECKKIAIMHYESTHFHIHRARPIREACQRLFARQTELFHDLLAKKLIYRLPLLI